MYNINSFRATVDARLLWSIEGGRRCIVKGTYVRDELILQERRLIFHLSIQNPRLTAFVHG